MSILSYRPNKQIAAGLFAARQFARFTFAASPTISIRSGMSDATLIALSPMDAVAPRITTRLRFILTTNGHEFNEMTKSEG
jgi:hypothetical protein